MSTIDRDGDTFKRLAYTETQLQKYRAKDREKLTDRDRDIHQNTISFL